MLVASRPAFELKVFACPRHFAEEHGPTESRVRFVLFKARAQASDVTSKALGTLSSKLSHIP